MFTLFKIIYCTNIHKPCIGYREKPFDDMALHNARTENRAHCVQYVCAVEIAVARQDGL